VVEDRLYRDVACQLRTDGQAVLHHEVRNQTPEAVAAVIRDAVLDLLGTGSG
jgi:hypothetical protein